MLTIYYKDYSFRVIRVNPEFFTSLRLGKGKHTRILTPEDKAYQIMLDKGGCGYKLHYSETKFTRNGFIPNKNFHFGQRNFSNKGRIAKKFRKIWKKENVEKHSTEIKHDLTIDKAWEKQTQKFILASSTTQLL